MDLDLDQAHRSCFDSGLDSRQDVRIPALDTSHIDHSSDLEGTAYYANLSLELGSVENLEEQIECH